MPKPVCHMEARSLPLASALYYIRVIFMCAGGAAVFQPKPNYTKLNSMKAKRKIQNRTQSLKKSLWDSPGINTTIEAPGILGGFTSCGHGLI